MTDQAPEKSPATTARKLNGLYIFGALLIIIAAVHYNSSVSTTRCDAEFLKTRPDVIMLGTWWCPYCAEARKYFHDNNVHYCEYDIDRSEEGEKLYRQANGGGIPILIIDNKKYIGFDARAFEQLMQSRQKS